jgi:hypothetical protein
VLATPRINFALDQFQAAISDTPAEMAASST